MVNFDPISWSTMHKNDMFWRWKTLITLKSFEPQFVYYLNMKYVQSQHYPMSILVMTVISVNTIVIFRPKFTCLKIGQFWPNFLDHDAQELPVLKMKNINYTEILWTTMCLLFEHEVCSITTLSHVYLVQDSHFSKYHC